MSFFWYMGSITTLDDVKNREQRNPVTEEEKREVQTAQKLKPKLRKFVRNLQQQKAAVNAQQAKLREEKLQKMEHEMQEVVNRAKVLSYLLFIEKKLWQEQQPVVEMKWLRALTITPQLEMEKKLDMWGFSRYLVKEYFENYLVLQNEKKGYANPMDEKNLVWFWDKFNKDLMVLLIAEKRRIAAGNKGVILQN